MNFDSYVDGGNNGGGTGHSFAFNNVGGNFVLIDFHGDNLGGADDITAVTYNAVGGVLVVKHTTGGIGDRYKYTYKFVGAPTGSHTVVISASSAHLIEAQAISYSSVSDVDAFVANFDNIGVTSLTTSITPTVAGCWVVCLEGGYNGGGPPAASIGLASTRGVDTVNGSYGAFDTNTTVTIGVPYSVTTTRSTTPTSYIQHTVLTLAPPTATVTQFGFCDGSVEYSEKLEVVSY